MQNHSNANKFVDLSFTIECIPNFEFHSFQSKNCKDIKIIVSIADKVLISFFYADAIDFRGAKFRYNWK